MYDGGTRAATKHSPAPATDGDSAKPPVLIVFRRSLQFRFIRYSRPLHIHCKESKCTRERMYFSRWTVTSTTCSGIAGHRRRKQPLSTIRCRDITVGVTPILGRQCFYQTCVKSSRWGTEAKWHRTSARTNLRQLTLICSSKWSGDVFQPVGDNGILLKIGNLYHVALFVCAGGAGCLLFLCCVLQLSFPAC